MIMNFKDKEPKLYEDVFIAENAVVIGDVTLHKDANIWFGAVVRGDVNSITIGEGSNIQDNCTVHVNSSGPAVEVGGYVTVGHNAVLHGCKIGDNCLIGMGAVVLDGVEIGNNTIIGAGSLVPPNKTIPSGVLCMGSPAKIIRELTEEEIEHISHNSHHYVELAKMYAK